MTVERDLSREGLIREMQRVASELGTDHVARAQWLRLTGIHERHVLKHFASYGALGEAAGLGPEPNRRLTDDDVLAAMRDVFVANGQVLPVQRTLSLAGHGTGTYAKRWGTWGAALLALRQWLEATGQDFPYLDQLPVVGLPKRDPVAPVPAKSATQAQGQPTNGARRFGPILNFRGLLHAPVNEQGVVLLFGMVARELGYIVESVQEGFPDCEGKRQVGPSSWERVRIEFEYQSRTFREHGHDPAACDLIVCWDDNWPEAPLPVLDLQTALRNLGS